MSRPPLSPVTVLACAAALSVGCTWRPPAASVGRDRAQPSTVAGAPRANSAAARVLAEPQVTSLAVAGSKLTRTRAVVLVEAPLEKVRATLFDFAHYPEFMPNYRASRLHGATPGGGTDVTMEIEQLGGLIKLRVRVEISAAKHEGGVETYDGRLLSGNVKVFQSRWQLERAAEGRTKLVIESLVDPDLPIPSGFINDGSIGGLREAILAIKARAELRAP